MGRWEPNAQGRLEQAALELFDERGYEQTTVCDIATRAGLTERTFFRYYADKREVLFGGSAAFKDVFIDGVAKAPVSASAMEAVRLALEAAASSFDEPRVHDFARSRSRIIVANAECRERELIKLADVTSAMAEALRERGVPGPTASLTAELGMAVFRVAFERWVADGEERSLSALVDEALSNVAAAVA